MPSSNAADERRRNCSPIGDGACCCPRHQSGRTHLRPEADVTRGSEERAQFVDAVYQTEGSHKALMLRIRSRERSMTLKGRKTPSPIRRHNEISSLHPIAGVAAGSPTRRRHVARDACIGCSYLVPIHCQTDRQLEPLPCRLLRSRRRCCQPRREES
jgi:hypothetical protein